VSRPRFARRVRGRRALTLAFAPRLIIQLSGGCHFGIASLETKTEALTDLIRVGGLWFYLVQSLLLLNRRRMGHVAAEFFPSAGALFV